MDNKQLKQLEERVAALEKFKKRAELIVREYELRKELRDILYSADNVFELKDIFEENQPGHYCKRCFDDKRELHRVNEIKPRPPHIGKCPPDGACEECGTVVNLKNGHTRYFKDQ